MTGIIKYLSFFTTVVMFHSPGALWAQHVITLRECYEAAAAATPISSEKTSYSEISGLKDRNISSAWYPSIDLNGSVLYNSDVVDLSTKFAALPIPGVGNLIGPMPHDQYKITLDINQVIYDGGAVKSARELEKADLKLNEKQTESDLYRIRSQVNTYYFGILLLKRQKELLGMYTDLLEKRHRSALSAVENGVMLKSDADVIRAEIINLKQQVSENEIKSATLLKALSDLTGIDIGSPEEMILPAIETEYITDITRPEIEVLEMRKELLSASESLSSVKRMPKAFGFASLGYGNPPGSNFFMDEFDTYYIIGAGIKWNIFDWNRSRNEKQVIALQKNMLDRRKTDLTENIIRQLYIKESEIQSLEKLVETDTELVNIRKKITFSAESQHLNGTITATEYLNILNAEKQAVINSEIHLINLALARIEYLNICGKDPE